MPTSSPAHEGPLHESIAHGREDDTDPDRGKEPLDEPPVEGGEAECLVNEEENQHVVGEDSVGDGSQQTPDAATEERHRGSRGISGDRRQDDKDGDRAVQDVLQCGRPG